MPIFTKILEQGKTSIGATSVFKPGAPNVRDWFRDKAREVRSVRVETLVSRNPQYSKNFVRPGFMYLFQYDPKHKEDLPYYDRFPLIFPFEDQGDSFLAMNLHYLPHVYRARLLDYLYDLLNNEKYNETSKIRASYKLLNAASRYKYFKPCVKRYLHSHVRSRFLQIPANEWDIAMFLPLERFAKKSKNYVYKESKDIINGV